MSKKSTFSFIVVLPFVVKPEQVKYWNRGWRRVDEYLTRFREKQRYVNI